MAPRRTRLGHAPEGDDGFSLVEVLVALVVLAIAMSALLMALGSAVQATKTSEQRTRASQFLQQRVEQLQALDYTTQAGFHAGDPGYAATAGGEPTVTLAGSRATPCPTTVLAADDPEPVPACPRVQRRLGGVVYTFDTSITWSNRNSAVAATPAPVAAPSAGAAPAGYAFKRVLVTTSWTDGAGLHTQRLEALRTPTSSEVVPVGLAPATPGPSATATPSASASASPLGTLTVTPAEQTLDGDKLVSTIDVTYVSSFSVTSVTGSWANGDRTSQPVTMTAVSGTGGKEWRGSLPAGSGGFVGGAFNFSVTSDAPVPDSRVNATVQLFDAVYVPVTVRTPVATPALCTQNGNSRLSRDSVVAVEVVGVSATDKVSMTFSDSDYAASYLAATPRGATSGGGQLFDVRLVEGKQFTTSATTVTVAVKRGTESWSYKAFSLPVQSVKGNGQCS